MRVARAALALAAFLPFSVACGGDDADGPAFIEVTLAEVGGGDATATVIVDRADLSATEDVAEDATGVAAFEVPAGAYRVSVRFTDECPGADRGSVDVDARAGETAASTFECVPVAPQALALRDRLTQLGHCEPTGGLGLVQIYGNGVVTDDGAIAGIQCGSLGVTGFGSASLLDSWISQLRLSCVTGGEQFEQSFARDGLVLLEGEEPALSAAASAVGLTSERYCPA